MKIITDRPPNYDAILKVFPFANRPQTIFAYAPDIYAPGGKKIPQAIIDHEYIHIMRQEEMGVEKWWELYLNDPEFRYVEELLAHRAEYRSLMAGATSRQHRRVILKETAKKLCSPLYGKMRTLPQAISDIQAGAA